MNTFKLQKKLALTIALTGLAGSVLAADGTINFTGTVSTTTCKIGNAEAGQANIGVTLDTVSATSLASNGQSAGTKPFEIQLSGAGCTNGKIARLYFENGASVDAATGMLNNTAPGEDAAKNVKVAILNKDLTRIAIGSASPNNSTQATITGNAATLQYYAQYHATGKATAGPVKASVAFSAVYN